MALMLRMHVPLATLKLWGEHSTAKHNNTVAMGSRCGEMKQ